MCDGVYQSVKCCEFSDENTIPCHSFTYPHLQIRTRPFNHSAKPASSTTRTVRT